MIKKFRFALHDKTTNNMVEIYGSGYELTIGRDDDSDIMLPIFKNRFRKGINMGISRKHAKLYILANKVQIEDVGSSCGTELNLTKLNVGMCYTLANNDLLTFHEYPIRFLSLPQDIGDLRASVKDARVIERSSNL